MVQSNGGDPRPVIPAAVGPTGVVNEPGRVPRESPQVTGAPRDPERDDANTNLLTAEAAASGATARGTDLPNTNRNPKQGAAPAREALDARQRDFQRIEQGWSVFSSDGEQLGQVSQVGPSWFAVPYGAGGERTMYLPIDYIETVTNTRVVLSQPAGLLIDMKLDRPPTDVPGEHIELGGVRHDPRRGEPANMAAVPEPEDIPAPAGAPPSAGRSTGGLRSEGSTPVESRGRSPEAALQPAESSVNQAGPTGPAVEGTVDGGNVSAASTPSGQARHNGVSTRMEGGSTPPGSTARERVNAQETMGGTLRARSGYTALTHAEPHDRPGGPTRQAGVMAGSGEHAPNRTQLTETGTPGEGRERNVTDLDLKQNRHPEGSAFDSQESTVGRPLAAGEPAAAQRSVPTATGAPSAAQDHPPDVPLGAVSRPASGSDPGGRS